MMPKFSFRLNRNQTINHHQLLKLLRENTQFNYSVDGKQYRVKERKQDREAKNKHCRRGLNEMVTKKPFRQN